MFASRRKEPPPSAHRFNRFWDIAERRGRIDSDQRQRLAGFLRDLPVTIDVETAGQAWAATSRLAAVHRLTIYDAAYLELAQRLSLPLATLDTKLRAAAAALGITLLGE